MNTSIVTMRPATGADAELLARGFLTAMWIEGEELRLMLPLCKKIAEREDTLYSWRHAWIAQCEGQDAGVLIAYDGADYKEMARTTFALVRDGGGADFTQMNAEAEPGEWYVDTLAVFPEFRRRGIATAMLRHAIGLGWEKEGVERATLYVDPLHPWVIKLYESVGFVADKTNVIFNQEYLKMLVPRTCRERNSP